MSLLGVPTPATLPVPGLCYGTNAQSPLLQCVLTGDWTNDLGSHMTIGAVNENGDFRGTYKTAVSGNMLEVPPSPLLGSQRITEERSQPTFGFTVHWKDTGASPFPASLWCSQSSPVLHGYVLRARLPSVETSPVVPCFLLHGPHSLLSSLWCQQRSLALH